MNFLPLPTLLAFMEKKYGSLLFVVLVALFSLPIQAQPAIEKLMGEVNEVNFHSSPAFSPDRRWLAYAVSTPMEEKELANGLQYHTSWVPIGAGSSRIQICDTTTGKVVSLNPVPGFRPSWSPDGRRLAFYGLSGEHVGLFVHELGGQTRGPLSEIAIHPRRWPGDDARWLDDRRVLVGAVRPQDTNWLQSMDRDANKKGEPTVQVTGRSGPNRDWGPADSVAPYIIDVISSEAQPVPIMPGGDSPTILLPSPSKTRLAYLTASRLDKNIYTCDLIVGPLAGEGEWTKISSLPDFYSVEPILQWHPTQDRLFFRHARRLHEVDLEKGSLKTFEPHPIDYPFTFSGDGKALFALQADDKFAPNWSSPSQTPRQLLRLDLDGTSRLFSPPNSPNQICGVFGDQVLLNGKNLILFDPLKNRSQAFQAGDFNCHVLSTPKGGRPIAAALLQSAQSPPDLYLLSDREPRRLTTIDPGLVGLAPIRVVPVTTTVEGAEGPISVSTSVVLPKNVSSSTPPPAVVMVYPGSFMSRTANRFGGGGGLPFQLFTQNGYAVILCDSPIGPEGVPGEPLANLNSVVGPQVDHVVKLGLVDGKRLAVLGQSHGGYAAAALCVGNNRFQASVALMGLYDLNAMYSNMKGAEQPFLTGQLRMGVSPWDDPERYRRNSPYARANEIETPMLLVAGGADKACPPMEGEKMWNALRLNDTPAEFVVYPGQSHAPPFWSHESRVDLGQRVLAFLKAHGVRP